jgi:uncharacterized protein involved in exopolysaccharide biosynthesis
MADDKNSDFDLSELLGFIFKHIKTIAIVGIVAAVLSSIVALLLTEYFTATAIIFPARTSSVALNEYTIRRGNISDFGEEEEAEQLLQIIDAVTLQEKVIQRHGLYEHYEIDPTEPKARSQMLKTYNDYVSARRTKFNSVEIQVVDKEPTVAAAMANSIVELIDTVKNGIISQRAGASFGMVDNAYQQSKARLEDVNSRMDSLFQLGVATEQERAAIYRAYGEALANGNRSAAQQLQSQIEINKVHGDEYDILKRQRDVISDEVMRLRSFREQYLTTAQSSMAQKFVVDKASIPDKKSQPIRWLIVVASVALSCLFALILLLFRERRPFDLSA